MNPAFRSPLVQLEDGMPLLLPVLGVYLQLEPIDPTDEERLGSVIAQVRDWIGHELRFTHTTTFSGPEPFRDTDLQYLIDHVRASAKPASTDNAMADEFVIRHRVRTRLNFSMVCKGGTDSIDASPYSFAFHCEIPNDKRALALDLPTCMLLTVPLDWPLEDFRRRAIALMDTPRIRWANAGYAFSGWEDAFYDEVHAGVFAHARRFPGFDVPEYVEHGDAFHERLRSVSWLTAVGPRLSASVVPPDTLLHSRMEQRSENLLFQAGSQPEPGDRNRLDFPPGYVEVDRVLARVRASGSGLHFLYPWSEATTESWIRRFEGSAQNGSGPT